MERSAMTVSRQLAVITPEYRLHSGFCFFRLLFRNLTIAALLTQALIVTDVEQSISAERNSIFKKADDAQNRGRMGHQLLVLRLTPTNSMSLGHYPDQGIQDYVVSLP